MKNTLQLVSPQATLTDWALHIAFLYALLETLFFLHQLYLIALIQTPSPRSRLTDKDCRRLFLRVLQSGLGTRQAEALARGSAAIEQKSAQSAGESSLSAHSTLSPLARESFGSGFGGLGGIPPTPEEEAQVELAYRVDERLRTEGEEREVRDILDEPAEDRADGEPYQGDRPPARRRSKQLERVLGASSGHDAENGDGVRSPHVWVTRLEEDDPKAIEFRERLRNW